MVMEFSFNRYNSTFDVNLEVATGTTVTVLAVKINSFADFAFDIFVRKVFLLIFVSLWAKENKRMFWVQGMVQPKG